MRGAAGFWRPRFWLPTVLALLVVALLWTWVARDNPYVLPTLPSVGRQFLDQPDLYVTNAWTTLQEALLGLLLGTLAAVVVAVAICESSLLRRGLTPLAVILNVTPVVAIAPALVVAFGFGMTPKLIVTGLITFFPVLMNTVTGLRSVDRHVLQVFRTVDASRLDVLLRLRFPSALPYLFSALRVVFPLSLVGAIVAEFSAAGAQSGLGTLISIASSNSQLDRVFAAIACLALMGSLMLLLVTTVERRALSWHESQNHR
ncbi:ABC transporter permease [Kineococcus rhizosphaerae]|uniref:NitT/TauT family transport system permease protein n=1 Tax=Kineococcus rhizosphaerae TaxID=559628 RepID=A0A2T0R9I1_9ACTN|nr:ABC transporter permease [Kineococcus rhizosphaerae]PRY17813.1 NitT/TauT family transport system permease protein [Kineococcus rhizosphaerae]